MQDQEVHRYIQENISSKGTPIVFVTKNDRDFTVGKFPDRKYSVIAVKQIDTDYNIALGVLYMLQYEDKLKSMEGWTLSLNREYYQKHNIRDKNLKYRNNLEFIPKSVKYKPKKD